MCVCVCVCEARPIQVPTRRAPRPLGAHLARRRLGAVRQRRLRDGRACRAAGDVGCSVLRRPHAQGRLGNVDNRARALVAVAAAVAEDGVVEAAPVGHAAEKDGRLDEVFLEHAGFLQVEMGGGENGATLV